MDLYRQRLDDSIPAKSTGISNRTFDTQGNRNGSRRIERVKCRAQTIRETPFGISIDNLSSTIRSTQNVGAPPELRLEISKCLREFCPPTDFALVLFTKTNFNPLIVINKGLSDKNMQDIIQHVRMAFDSKTDLETQIASSITGSIGCSTITHGINDNDRENFSLACYLGRYNIKPYRNLFNLISPYFHIALENIRKSELVAASNDKILSRRESEILDWVSQGKTNGEIAFVLSISAHTVKNHMANILEKLNVRNRAHAVEKARSLKQIKTGVDVGVP